MKGSKRSVVNALFGAALLSIGAAAQASPLPVSILGAGSYGRGSDPAAVGMKSIDVAALPQQQMSRLDVQYDGVAYYRGVPLREIIAAYNPPKQIDLALLCFRNGMIVPLPFRDASTMERLNPLVALGMATTPAGPFSARFPSINRHLDGYPDIPQVLFFDNKLVVGSRWHPDLPPQMQKSFSPWTMTDSLTSIVFAERRAYYRQFEVPADAQAGAELYRQSCQYCHGVRQVGATFGWDFGLSTDLRTYRKDPARLYFHLHDRPVDRVSLDQMPAIKYITEEQALQLWLFMKAASTTTAPPYTPSR